MKELLETLKTSGYEPYFHLIKIRFEHDVTAKFGARLAQIDKENWRWKNDCNRKTFPATSATTSPQKYGSSSPPSFGARQSRVTATTTLDCGVASLLAMTTKKLF